MEIYLRPTKPIDCQDSSLKEKAQGLTEGKQDELEKAKSLFYFVRDEIKYNPYMAFNLTIESFQASTILERKEGFCIQKAVLLTALARATGIPARLGFADLRNHLAPEEILKIQGTDLFTYHGYCELYLKGKWVKATPAFDLATCQKNQIIPVEFDGENQAVFHRYNREGKLHIEYIHDHGYYDDLPIDEIAKNWAEVYPLADFFKPTSKQMTS
jgi:transglutaminase-like putative cysteine protease